MIGSVEIIINTLSLINANALGLGDDLPENAAAAMRGTDLDDAEDHRGDESEGQRGDDRGDGVGRFHLGPPVRCL